jgi:hypothetical protein
MKNIDKDRIISSFNEIESPYNKNMDINEFITKLENELYMEIINELEETWEGDEYFSDDESFRSMLINDRVDLKMMVHMGEQFYHNLIEAGFEFDGEYWKLPNETKSTLTCYGVVWDYWYGLDTCVRETVGDIFEGICIDLDSIKDIV